MGTWSVDPSGPSKARQGFSLVKPKSQKQRPVELRSTWTGQRPVPTRCNLRSQRLSDRARDILRQRLHLLFRLRFDHHPRQRFRSRVAHHHAPIPIQLAFGGGDRLSEFPALWQMALSRALVRSESSAGKTLRSLTSSASGFPVRAIVSMTRSAVSRPSPVVASPSRKIMWPDCSPPSIAPLFLHLFEHVLVADIRAQHANAGIAQSNFQSHIRHGGRHYGFRGQRSLRLHIAARPSAGRHRHSPPGRWHRRTARGPRRHRRLRPGRIVRASPPPLWPGFRDAERRNFH